MTLRTAGSNVTARSIVVDQVADTIMHALATSEDQAAVLIVRREIDALLVRLNDDQAAPAPLTKVGAVEPPCPDERLSWAVEQRLAWIKESVEIFGFINREHIEKKFWVSTLQASADLKRAQDRWPDLIQYDRSQKRYVGVLS